MFVGPGQAYYEGRHPQDDRKRHTDDDKWDVGIEQEDRKNDPEYSKDAYQPFPGSDGVMLHGFFAPGC